MTPGELSDRQRRLKAEFTSRRGQWTSAFDQLLRYDPEYFERFLRLTTHPQRRGELDPKLREFVHIVMNSTPAVHLSADETRRHVANAFDHGASFEEILEVFEIVSTVGIHSVIKGIPTLIEWGDDRRPVDGGDSDEKERVKEYFVRKRGFWDDDLWGAILSHDPAFLELYADFSAHPWENGVLGGREKELLYIAMDVGTPHFFTVGLGPHIRNAFDHGATAPEILEVFEIQLEYGVQSIKHGLPILVEEAEKRGALPDG